MHKQHKGMEAAVRQKQNTAIKSFIHWFYSIKGNPMHIEKVISNTPANLKN